MWASSSRSGDLAIVFGICLLIIAAIVPKLAVLWGIGIIVLVVGVILVVLGSMGRAVGGRRHYY
jgi:membrane-bound ClpP family serine protease